MSNAMSTTWKILKFVGQVIALACAAFAGSAISGCMFAF